VICLTISDESGETYHYGLIQHPTVQTQHDAVLLEVDLGSGIGAGKKLSLTVEMVYYNRMNPLPKKIRIKDNQLMFFTDNSAIFSPYDILHQKSSYYLSSTPIKYTVTKNSKGTGKVIAYEFKQTQDAFTTMTINVHFQNNFPFCNFKKASKQIEVSHWGNIAIEEKYLIKNEGAELTGEYGRVDFNQYTSDSGMSALKELDAEYPIHTWGMYYTDDIGNISTSNAFRDVKKNVVKLNLRPRFSIFGGWKTNWVIGYNFPTYHYLYNDNTEPDAYYLKQLFSFPFRNIVAEKYELSIILPEGATDIEYDLPFDVDEIEEGLHFSYLDYWGRPKITFRKSKVQDLHNLPIFVKYRFDKNHIYLEPAILVTGFSVLFLGLIWFGRLSFNFVKLKTQ